MEALFRASVDVQEGRKRMHRRKRIPLDKNGFEESVKNFFKQLKGQVTIRSKKSNDNEETN